MLNLESFVLEDKGSSPGVAGYLVCNGAQWRGSVSLARVNPAINRYLEKSGEGKEEECAKAQDSQTPLHFLAEGP